MNARPARWCSAMIALHWTAAAAAIAALIGIGWLMRHGGLDAAATFELFQLHKSLGFVALAFTAARIATRLMARAPSAPSSPRWEHSIAVATQASLYGLTIAASLLGWLAASASPLPIPTRIFGFFTAPNLTAANPALYSEATQAHAFAGWAIAALVALHICGALKHHFIDREDTLTRILPRFPGRKR